MICDCNLKWMVKWIVKSRLDRRLFIKGICEEFFKLRDKIIVSVNKKEMICGKVFI